MSILNMICDIKGAAEILNLKGARIRQLLGSGELPGRKLGIGWVMVTADVRQYARDRRMSTKH